MKRCNLCILPDSFPNIKFSKDGICNHCLNYKEASYKGKLALKKILEPYKNKTKKYNCIVPLSGGKDSTFVLFYAVKMLHLKPIAINYNSGFQSKIAKENMKNICGILNVPLIIKKSNKINKKLLKEALLISEILGSFFGICGNCEAILRSVSINLAKKKNISLILWGSSSIESTESEVNKSNVVGKKGFIRNLRNIKKFFRASPHIIKYYLFSVLQRIQMGIPKKYILNILNKVPFPKKQIKVVYFFDYMKYNSIKITKTLKKELKWKHPTNKEDRFDCLLHSFINHHCLQLLGISADGYVYSKIIRNRALRRSKALLKEEHIKKMVGKECRKIINKLGLNDYKMPKIKNLRRD